MSGWTVRRGIQHWVGVFIEPDLGSKACGDKRGTPTGANRHRAADETPCRACRDARRDYQKHGGSKTCADCGTHISRLSTWCNTHSRAHRGERNAA